MLSQILYLLPTPESWGISVEFPESFRFSPWICRIVQIRLTKRNIKELCHEDVTNGENLSTAAVNNFTDHELSHPTVEVSVGKSIYWAVLLR